MPIHSCTLPDGSKGFQWGAHGKCYRDRKEAEKQAEAAHANGFTGDSFALDKASMRRTDADGRLHIAITNISKATVNPYRGDEIPGWQSLGLTPDRVYQLLRHPDELDKAAPTFNNIQLLVRHVPVSAEDPQKDLVVGSTGTDAEFASPYLRNSLVVWDASAIAGIESREQQELSCSYRYVPVMTPGTFDGVEYDGVMTNLVGNHVALVETGRAGPDVVVSDANPFLEQTMKKASSKTIAVRAAVRAHLRPLLAADAALDVKALVGNIGATSIELDAERIAKGAKTKVSRVDTEALRKVVMDAAKDAEKDADEAEDDDDDDKDDTAGLKRGEDESEEDFADRVKKAKDKKAKDKGAKDKRAKDETEEERKKREAEGGRKANAERDDKEAHDRKAMDAAIQQAETAAVHRMRAIQQAEKDVQPILGEVAAMDSAEAVYKLALDHLAIDCTDVHPSAYAALVKQHVAHSSKPRMAHDSAGAKGFWDQFPGIKLPTRV